MRRETTGDISWFVGCWSVLRIKNEHLTNACREAFAWTNPLCRQCLVVMHGKGNGCRAYLRAPNWSHYVIRSIVQAVVCRKRRADVWSIGRCTECLRGRRSRNFFRRSSDTRMQMGRDEQCEPSRFACFAENSATILQAEFNRNITEFQSIGFPDVQKFRYFFASFA